MIKELKEVLEVLQAVGVDEAVIEPNEDNDDESIVRAASKDGNIVIYDSIKERFSECVMGISSVRGMLSRINLFDIEKASIDLNSNDDKNVMDMVVKQGRRKASYRFSNPSRIIAPNEMPQSVHSDVITFSAEYVQYLSKAVAAMSYTGNKEERTISIQGDGKEVSIKIFDGEDDSFNESLEMEVETEKGSWEMAPFHKVMNEASKYNGEASFTIDNLGIAKIDLAIMSAMIVPMTS